MMSKEANIRAILECNFTGFKDEIIDKAVELICDLECEPITSPSQYWAKQAENFGEIAMNEIDKARSYEDCFTDEEKRIFLASVAREMRVCEVIDSEKTKVKLVPILERVKDKVLRSSLWKEVEE